MCLLDLELFPNNEHRKCPDCIVASSPYAVQPFPYYLADGSDQEFHFVLLYHYKTIYSSLILIHQF